MKMLAAALLVLFSTGAMADSMRPVSTDNLTCTGTAKNKPKIALLVQARNGATKITLKQGQATREILNKESLIVGSEGNVYIQQVSNELGYNLYLAGQDLWDVLSGKARTVSVNGNINFFREDVTYQLTCQGDLR